MRISIQELESLVMKALQTAYTAEHAELIKDVMLYGEISGTPSHGILRLLKENYGVFVETPPGAVTYDHRTKVSTVINGHGNPGMLVGALALKEAIQIANQHDIAVVGTKGSVNTSGALAYYVNAIAQEGFIGIVMAQSSLFMSAFGSKKAIFGTNPMAFGIPAPDQPLIFDLAMSATTFGAVAKAKAEGKPLPPNNAIDSEGNMTMDAAKAVDGALLPFDNSYKSSGLSMMVEILAALWPGAGFAGLHGEDGWGNIFLAFHPNLLSDQEEFKTKVQQLREKLVATETATGDNIRIPGEKTQQLYNETISKGEIEVSENSIERIKKI